MTYRGFNRGLIGMLLTLFLFCSPASADDLLIVRTAYPFPEAMLALKEAIKAQGFQVSRVQRVDVGLTRNGFQSDKYRIVFFGRPDEVRRLLHDHPMMAPYLPLKITIFAEADDTLLTTFDPVMLQRLAPQDRALGQQLQEWKVDLLAIFKQLREGG